jgi:hypothetical protein
MYKVLKYIGSFKRVYFENSVFSKVKDKFSFNYNGECYVEKLDLLIREYKIPSNLHKNAYERNLDRIMCKNKNFYLSPQFYRMYDYNYYTQMQKKILSFAVEQSISSILRLQKKSLYDACIVINNAEYKINEYIICELAKKCRYLILCVPEKCKKGEEIYEKLISNLGISTLITNDSSKCKADFIITCSPVLYNVSCPIWYIDNSICPRSYNNIVINKIFYNSPWAKIERMEPEMLAIVLKLLEGNDIEDIMDNNKINMESINFNDYRINF